MLFVLDNVHTLEVANRTLQAELEEHKETARTASAHRDENAANYVRKCTEYQNVLAELEELKAQPAIALEASTSTNDASAFFGQGLESQQRNSSNDTSGEGTDTVSLQANLKEFEAKIRFLDGEVSIRDGQIVEWKGESIRKFMTFESMPLTNLFFSWLCRPCSKARGGPR